MFSVATLRYFLAAYEAQNLRKAAEATNVTQPAMTKGIQRLEAALGVTLFTRSASGVRPTDFATTFRAHALRIVNEARLAELEIAAARRGEGGQLRLAVGQIWSLTILPQLIKTLHERFPALEIDARTGIEETMAPLLHSGEIDLWLGSLVTVTDSAELVVTPLGEARMTLYARDGHPLCGGATTLAGVSRYPIAGFSPDRQGLDALTAAFAAEGLAPPRMSLRFDALGALLDVACESDILVFAADTLHAAAAARRLKELAMPVTLWRIPIGAACRRAAAELTATRVAIEALTTAFAQQSANHAAPSTARR